MAKLTTNTFFNTKNIVAFSFFLVFLIVISVIVTIFFLGVSVDDVKTIITAINYQNWGWIFVVILGFLVSVLWNVIINW